MILQRHAIRVIFLVCKNRFSHQKKAETFYMMIYFYIFSFSIRLQSTLINCSLKKFSDRYTAKFIYDQR